jgi:hypothetical protein
MAMALAACASHAINIEPPKIKLVDALGVNMTTGQVTHTLTPVSIGGDMGLAYTISIYANEARWGAEGFSAAYSGQVQPALLTQEIGYTPWYVMRASDGMETADFKVLVNGVLQSSFFDLPPPYDYVPVGDQRQSLEVNGSYFDWTKPDGTVVRFSRGGTAAGSAGGLMQITKPNGFIVTLSSGITSNTGFQLRPITVMDNRPFDKPDNPNLQLVPPATTSAGSGWSSTNPTYVKALNNAVEYCAPGPAACSPTLSWPTATLEWPAGMPRTLFIGDSVVKVTDARGGTTELRYRAYDLAYDQYGNVIAGYQPGTLVSPRIAGIKPAGSTQESFVYDYINFYTYNSSPWGNYMTRMQTAGLVKTATHIGKQAYYTMLTTTMGGRDYRNNAGGDGGVSAVHIQPRIAQANTDMIWFAQTLEGKITFETNNARNFPSLFEKISGPTERYSYDARGNLSKVEYLVGGTYVMQRQAQYPASCTAATRKTCNQAEWIEDANGNRTSYTYHPQSGQVENITSPPDQDGKRAQTRYEYTQLSARYFAGGSTKINGSPIWMKTAEKYCIDSSYSGGCQGGDEVVKRFEYNHDNLLMTGMTVTADGTTLRTCFQYDRFGNQIGTTTPNAHRTSCN